MPKARSTAVQSNSINTTLAPRVRPVVNNASLTFTPATTPLLSGRRRGSRLIVLADANALISDAIRLSRGGFCLMSFMAEQGLIRLLTAAHMDQMVYRGLPAACRHAHADLDAAVLAYETTHRRLLRFVDAGDLMSAEPRVIAARVNDTEDAALAQLGVLLAPSLILTRDHHLRDIGLASENWADQLVLVKGLAELDDLMWGTAEGVAGVGALAAVGIQGLIDALRGSNVLLGLTIGLSLALGYQYRHRVRELPAAAKARGGPAARQVLEQTGAAMGRWQQTQTSVETHLISPAPEPPLQADVAVILAQRDAPLSAALIHDALPYARQAQLGMETLKRVLREEPAFELVVGRGRSLGHPAGPSC